MVLKISAQMIFAHIDEGLYLLIHHQPYYKHKKMYNNSTLAYERIGYSVIRLNHCVTR